MKKEKWLIIWKDKPEDTEFGFVKVQFIEEDNANAVKKHLEEKHPEKTFTVIPKSALFII